MGRRYLKHSPLEGVSHDAFPAEALEKVLAARRKSLAFGSEEIEDLLDIEYGDRRVFPLLSMLYPFIDARQLHLQDGPSTSAGLIELVVTVIGVRLQDAGIASQMPLRMLAPAIA